MPRQFNDNTHKQDDCGFSYAGGEMDTKYNRMKPNDLPIGGLGEVNITPLAYLHIQDGDAKIIKIEGDGIDRWMDASFSYKKLLKTITIFFLCLSIFALSIFTVKPDGVKTYAASTGMAVVEVTTKRTLFESNANQRMPMASTTKAMTALVVLENSELDEMVTVPRQAVGVEGSSIYLKGVKADRKRIVVRSYAKKRQRCGGGACTPCGGSLDGFANMMNEKAKQLGLKNTHFTNPHGLHDDNHYTTAYDLAICSAYAMQNKDFAEIVGAKSYTINSPQGKRYLVNKNKILTTYEGERG